MKNPESENLKKAIESAQNGDKKELNDFIKKAFEDDNKLIAIMDMLIPDAEDNVEE